MYNARAITRRRLYFGQRRSDTSTDEAAAAAIVHTGVDMSYGAAQIWER